MAIALASLKEPSRSIPQGLEIPGTMDHILEILRCWFDDMQQLRSALGRLAAMPTLLIWGDRDRAVNLSSALGLQRTLVQSRLLVIEGAGHLPFEEMPEACNLAMRDWLARLARP